MIPYKFVAAAAIRLRLKVLLKRYMPKSARNAIHFIPVNRNLSIQRAESNVSRRNTVWLITSKRLTKTLRSSYSFKIHGSDFVFSFQNRGYLFIVTVHDFNFRQDNKIVNNKFH